LLERRRLPNPSQHPPVASRQLMTAMEVLMRCRDSCICHACHTLRSFLCASETLFVRFHISFAKTTCIMATSCRGCSGRLILGLSLPREMSPPRSRLGSSLAMFSASAGIVNAALRGDEAVLPAQPCNGLLDLALPPGWNNIFFFFSFALCHER